MASSLIIVESPAKARTLRRFLGPDYNVQASMGHIRDLPEKELAVDVDKDFAPHYVISKGKEKIISELRAAVKNADDVFLASDPDREGEAIAWHLAEVLKLKNPRRIEFHEITKTAVLKALSEGRDLDLNRVNAQQARRIVDRLVGYKISPFLWKSIAKGLSAGRVQSVALRLVCDREEEIRAFITEESWSLDALLSKAGAKEVFKARLNRLENSQEKIVLAKEDDAKIIMTNLKGAAYKVLTSSEKERAKFSYPPYITSTLQQDASVRLRYNPKRSMRIAQQLYEGVDLGNKGAIGLITYMRTDSTRVADEAEVMVRAYIKKEYGDKYLGGKRKEKVVANAQGAHECIRPTDVNRTPQSVAAHLSDDQAKLYELIWKRFVASRMAPASFNMHEADILAGKYIFRASGSELIFDGFYKIWPREEDKEEDLLPKLTPGEVLDFKDFLPEQHYTQPPPRYSEASLIKELEKRGIGRPSTYASIVGTIQERGYTMEQERRLHPTPLGEAVTKLMVANFPEVVSDQFTATMESSLDQIEAGTAQWIPIVSAFYEPLAILLANAKAPLPESTGEVCPECNEGELMTRTSRYGAFLSCSRYPECKYKRDENQEAQKVVGDCPQCGKGLVEKRSKTGAFIACSGYPECKYIQPGTPTDIMCELCGKPMMERKGKFGKFLSCSGYPECQHKVNTKSRPGTNGKPPDKGIPVDVDCPLCGKGMLKRKGRFGSYLSCSDYPTCKGTKQIKKEAQISIS